MVDTKILLEEFRTMTENLERRGMSINRNFETLFQSFIVAIKLIDKPIIEILEREVTRYGTGAHIVVPQKHLGKRVIIISVKNNK